MILVYEDATHNMTKRRENSFWTAKALRMEAVHFSKT
jgi:hypothetical protein